ncbi:MAG: S41 family peptidase, partial [Alistipes sp.]|nr:S41 family peptidase [Alistipes sp.]
RIGVQGAAEGKVRALDPNKELIPEEGMSDFELLTTGKYGGIGALIRQKEDYVRIAQPYEGSPADRAGLKIGDMILAIDGTDAKGFTTEQVSSRLKGEPGSKVRVTVRHLDGTEQTETIRRERIAIPGIPYAGWLDEGIGYIRHSDFTEGCYEEMRTAIERLRAEGELRGLVLDYRSNGGGIMQEAVKILGLFVPKGTEVLSTKGRTEESKQSYRTETEPLLPDLPLAVLVNGNSASASEIVAGALQDLDRAVLVGQRSFGKGLVQSSRPLGYNAMLKLTTAKYYIPSGRCIQAIDYSHSQQGSVRTVPDSLISEFSTRAGRKVYDGGGIMPDIHTEAEYISRFAATLYALGFIEDFGDEYTRRNPTLAGDPVRFSITEADYADFAEFMKDKEVPYESDTRRALKALQKAAESDRFSELKERFGELEAELGDDTQTNLETYRRQIVESIESDIIQRHAYTSGVIAHSLLADKEVHRAVEALRDTAEYRRITTEQDTEKQFKTKN